MRGGRREGSGRKIIGESKAVQKSIALPSEAWERLKSTDNAKKILTAFANLGKEYDLSNIEIILNFMMQSYKNKI